MKGSISTTFFGFFSYVIALITMASPWLFGFVHFGGASLFIPLLFGWFHLIMAIFSNTKAGMVGVFPIQMHCVLNVLSGFILLVSPWLYAFSPNVFLPHLILGGLIFLSGILVKNSPLTNRPHEMLQEAGITSTDAHEGRLMI
jgi:hypothetical protein